MATTIHFSQISKPQLLDVLDDEWMQDTLPDDDIPLPEGYVPPTEESEDVREDAANQPKQPEKWGELGLNTVH
ncbi:hypothetical protein WJX72_005537 [[Myrmecia] bisecta]|uniref:Anaphase-promoting complex subunit 13 n=1 Tax=[Myrmecia] bisecta TaxID=41462 RepID=A0AAW1QFB9_9CHLO